MWSESLPWSAPSLRVGSSTLFSILHFKYFMRSSRLSLRTKLSSMREQTTPKCSVRTHILLVHTSCGRKKCCRGDGSCGFVLVDTLLHQHLQGSVLQRWGVLDDFLLPEMCKFEPLPTSDKFLHFSCDVSFVRMLMFSSFFLNKMWKQKCFYWFYFIFLLTEPIAFKLSHPCRATKDDTMRCVDSTESEPKEDLSFLSINKVSRVRLTSNFL